MPAKPFVKWAGGKTQLLETLRQKYPLLNKTCFNGFFNAPFNNAKNPTICDEENLQECSRLLQNVEMLDGDYKNCRNFIDDEGVPAKAVGCSALRYRSSSSLRCGGLLRRCSIA